MIRPANPIDAEAIAANYNHYVTETIVTFEEEPVTAADIAQRIADVHAAAYRYSTEVTVYVVPGLASRGIGSRLYEHLIPELRARNIHAAMGAIALPNEASIRLHEKFGFRKVAHFQQAGFKFNRWIDVGYWQLLL